MLLTPFAAVLLPIRNSTHALRMGTFHLHLNLLLLGVWMPSKSSEAGWQEHDRTKN